MNGYSRAVAGVFGGVLCGLSSAASGQAVLALTPASTCVHDASRTVVVHVDLSGATSPVVGGQFFLQYDTSLLTFVSIAPGNPPFTTEVYGNEPGPGLIDYAVGVPGGGPGTLAGATMAVITFEANQDLCFTGAGRVSFRTSNPPTRVTDNTGAPMYPAMVPLQGIRIDSIPPQITCPPDVIVRTHGTTADAGAIFGDGWALEGSASFVVNPGIDVAVRLDAHDYLHSSAVRYAPQSPLPFSSLTVLSADYNMQCGRFGCGSPRWTMRIDADNDGGASPGDKNLRILWGTHPLFDDCPGHGSWLSTGNAMASPDARFDTSEFPGGAFFDTYAHALSLIGSKKVLEVRAVADETCSATSCTSNCATTNGGRILLIDNININGTVQRFETPTATDNCTPAPSVSATRSDSLPLDAPYPTGRTTITWTATDQCGNTASCNQLVQVVGPCGSADFNCDGDIGTDLDIEVFFACIAGHCPPPPCTSIADFNGDGDVGTDADIEAFFRVLAGGSC